MSKIELAKDLVSFFEEQVQNTAKAQALSLSPWATSYLGKMLVKFSDTKTFLRVSSVDPLASEGELKFPTLAWMWFEALAQGKSYEQLNALAHLGDVALFSTGFFADRIQRDLDLDYFSAVGGRAYKRAGEISQSMSEAEQALNIYFELAANFSKVAHVLEEISDRSSLQMHQDLIKLYEKWMANRSAHIERLLIERGMIPRRGNHQT